MTGLSGMRLVALALLGAPALLAGQSTVTAFTNVTVIPMDTDRTLADYTVLVRGDRIVEMGPSARVQIPSGATRIDGRGKWLMPGMSEMHGHIPPGDQPTDAEIEKILAYFALNGVTTVRGMLGHPRHLPFRERANRGEILAPYLWTTGPSLNGNSLPTTQAAIDAVTAQKAAGYDLMKIHPGITPEIYDSMAATAQRVGIRFAGHVPLQVGLRRALARGQWTIDHVDGYIEALAWDGNGTAPQSAFFAYNLVAQADESRLPALVAATRAAGAAIVPTQSLFESVTGEHSPDAMAQWPEMRLWPAAQVQSWIQNTNNIRQGLQMTPEAMRSFNELRRRIMQALHRGGVPFLLGSDAPQWWNVPGYSVQREMDAMAKAGFTPFEIYAMGSRNVAQHFGRDDFGTVATGKRADLVLLDANPLATVANWSQRAGVMVKGRWYDRAEIARRIAALQ